MAQIRVEPGTLGEMLRSHGEDDLAARASSITDDELTRIQTLGAYYAWSEGALALGGSIGGARALSLATMDDDPLDRLAAQVDDANVKLRLRIEATDPTTGGRVGQRIGVQRVMAAMAPARPLSPPPQGERLRRPRLGD